MILAQALHASTATVYLSGPMTGYVAHNFPAFIAAAAGLRMLGYAVLSPAEKDLQAGFDPASDGEGFDLRAALEWDVEAVMQADAVVVLPGWEDSPGCAIEVTVAKALGKPVVRAEDVLIAPRVAS